MIYLLIIIAIAAGMIGFGLGGCLAYNRGFGDGMEIGEDFAKRDMRELLGLVDEVIKPGSIVKPENGWAKFDGSETPESAQTGF